MKILCFLSQEMKNCELDCDEMRTELKNLRLEVSALKKQVFLKEIMIFLRIYILL